MQVFLLVIFASIITIPIMQTLQDNRVSPLEAVIASPVRPIDVLVGRFLGSLPFYCLVVVLIAGTFLALFIPFGMSPAQVALSVLVFLLVVVSGLWIGILLAAVLKARLGRTPRGRDMGQALALMIALPLVAVMYGIMNGGLFDAVEEGGSTLPTVLWLLPSSWGADVVLIFLRNPGDLSQYWQVTVLGLGTLMMFFFGSLYVGSKLSGRAYDLEPVSFTSPLAGPEGRIYRSVRALTGDGPFSVVVLTVLKDYVRRMENLSRVIYILGLVVLMEIFLLGSLPPGNYNSIALLTISWMMAFLCVFVVGEVTTRGKDNLFVYRKAPKGETRLVWARVVQGWLVVLPVAGISALVVLVPSDTPWQEVGRLHPGLGGHQRCLRAHVHRPLPPLPRLLRSALRDHRKCHSRPGNILPALCRLPGALWRSHGDMGIGYRELGVGPCVARRRRSEDPPGGVSGPAEFEPAILGGYTA